MNGTFAIPYLLYTYTHVPLIPEAFWKDTVEGKIPLGPTFASH